MQCPSCLKEVAVKDKDFGALFKCSLCGDVYFLNFDGTPDFSQMQEQPSAEELLRLQNQALPDKKKNKKNSGAKESSDLETPEVDASIFHEENASLQSQPADQFQTEPLPIEPMPIEPMPIESLSPEAPSIENLAQEASSDDFGSIVSELESFGNRQTVVAGISYDLEVTGLDSKEAQELFREAIDDSRLGWHTDDLVREIRTGVCKFKNLTPVQAFVLAKRIQFIDIEMKWKQNVLA